VDSIEIELTDPAKELASLGQRIVDAAGGGVAIKGLSQCIGISMDDAEFLEVLAAIQRRVRDVESLADAANSSDFDQELKNEVLTATRNFTLLLHPKNAHVAWDQLRLSHLPAKSITALKFFSQTARRYRPLRVIPNEKREEVLVKIVETRELVLKDDDLQEWMKTVLISGLNRVHLIIRHLQFYGHEFALIELFLAHQGASVVASVENNDAIASGKSSVWQALAALSIVGGLFILPDQAITAFDRYKTWPSAWSDAVLRVITVPQSPAEQRLLPAPAAIVSKPDEEAPPKRVSDE